MNSDREHDHTLPWMFRRDEIDVLEEEFDDIFHRHSTPAHAKFRAIEEPVLREQMDTEEATEADLAARMGMDWLAAAPGGPASAGAACAHDDLASVRPLRESLRRDITRDPFYERAYLWASRTFRWARDRYANESLRTREVFRVYVNAFLVPAKIAFAQAEESHEEPDVLEVAAKEYELAATYLDRARESLTAIWESGVTGTDMAWMRRESDEIAQILRETRKRIDSLRNAKR